MRFKVFFSGVVTHDTNVVIDDHIADWETYCEQWTNRGRPVDRRDFHAFTGWLFDVLSARAADDADLYLGDFEVTEVEPKGDFDFTADDFFDLIDIDDPDAPPRPGPGQLDIFGNETPARHQQRTPE